jgi:hypothetical protein
MGMTSRNQVRRLRREAERCFRLANGTANPKLSEELEAIGHEYEREAEALEDGDRRLAA